jgi:hypothetical protein
MQNKISPKSKEYLKSLVKSLLFDFKLLPHTDIIKNQKIPIWANFMTFRASLIME